MMKKFVMRCALMLMLGLAASGAQAQTSTKTNETLRFACRGWMPIYLGSWVPINPDPSDMDSLTIEVNQATRMTSFVLTMIGRANFATKINESQIKGAIAFKQMMIDDFIEYIDFMLNRGTGEIIITALEKGRRGHTLYRGKCVPVKSSF